MSCWLPLTPPRNATANHPHTLPSHPWRDLLQHHRRRHQRQRHLPQLRLHRRLTFSKPQPQPCSSRTASTPPHIWPHRPQVKRRTFWTSLSFETERQKSARSLPSAKWPRPARRPPISRSPRLPPRPSPPRRTTRNPSTCPTAPQPCHLAKRTPALKCLPILSWQPKCCPEWASLILIWPSTWDGSGQQQRPVRLLVSLPPIPPPTILAFSEDLGEHQGQRRGSSASTATGNLQSHTICWSMNAPTPTSAPSLVISVAKRSAAKTTSATTDTSTPRRSPSSATTAARASASPAPWPCTGSYTWKAPTLVRCAESTSTRRPTWRPTCWRTATSNPGSCWRSQRGRTAGGPVATWTRWPTPRLPRPPPPPLTAFRVWTGQGADFL